MLNTMQLIATKRGLLLLEIDVGDTLTNIKQGRRVHYYYYYYRH